MGLYSFLSETTGRLGAETSLAEMVAAEVGLVAVVIVVFKFMLGRSDKRDAIDDKRHEETLAIVRRELAEEKFAHEITRGKLLEVLEELAESKHE